MVPPKKTGSSHLKRHQTRARRDRCARTPPSRAENLLGTGNNNRLCSRFLRRQELVQEATMYIIDFLSLNGTQKFHFDTFDTLPYDHPVNTTEFALG